MNRRMTLILAVVAVAIGSVILLSEQRGSSGSRNDKRGQSAPLVLDLNELDIMGFEVKRDYWNSFQIARQGDGSWRFLFPKQERASDSIVQKFISTISVLPAQMVIDTAGGDTERYQQYGLWEPTLELVISLIDREHTLVFGSETSDGSGYYCVVGGREEVHVIPRASYEILSADIAKYRQEG